MIHKVFLNILKPCNCKIIIKRNSALFISGAKATENFVYLTPHVDVPEILKDRDLIQEQLLRRQINFDIDKLDNLWGMYSDLNSKKSDLDKKKEEISKELVKLIKNEPESDATKKLKLQSNLVKDNLKKLKMPLWSAEEAVIVEALKLPNEIHNETPDKDRRILYTYLSPPNNRKDHLKIGTELNLIYFKKNENYYLKGDAALFELGAKFYFADTLRKNKMIQFSNPDFVKSLIVEGCGKDHTDPANTFILHHNEEEKMNADSRLHLTGGGSLYSFFAYHAKNVLYPKLFPLKYFSMGRQYVPSPSDEDSLFHVSQSSVVEFFGGAKTAEELDTLLNEVIDILKMTYSNLGFHFRIALVPAHKLLIWESMRVSVEMYSSSLCQYIEVGNVSLSQDYISKRLMFTYVENKNHKFPHIISGTILNVPKLLACVLEQDAEFSVPNVFRPEMWTI